MLSSQEEETLAFEEPAYGDPSLICEAGQDHGALGWFVTVVLLAWRRAVPPGCGERGVTDESGSGGLGLAPSAVSGPSDSVSNYQRKALGLCSGDNGKETNAHLL